MLPHELIDDDKPICLYCKERCKANYEGGFDTAFVLTNIYTCTSCNEVFKIYYDIGQDPKAFAFTCFELVCLYVYKKHTLFLGVRDKLCLMPVSFFEIDFYNKAALYDKIKTYLLFS